MNRLPVPTARFCSLPCIARYLHASLSRSATGQRTPIAETINEAAGDQRLEEGETEEEEEGEEYEEDSAHFAEADSVFEVEPNPEVKWRYMLRQDLRQDNGDNRKPQLPRTDGEFAHRYNVLLIGIWKWASKYFAPHDVDHVKEADLRDEHMLHSYIDSIAMATSPDIRWNDVIQTLLPRLVMGIIMKVIQIHIFGLELFGASQAQLRILRLADKFRTERDHECISPLSSSFIQLAWCLFPANSPFSRVTQHLQASRSSRQHYQWLLSLRVRNTQHPRT